VVINGATGINGQAGIPSRSNGTILIEEIADEEHGVAVAGDDAAGVTKLAARLDLGDVRAGLEDLAVLVRQRSAVDLDLFGGGAALVKRDVVGGEVQETVAGHLPTVTGEGAGAELQRAGTDMLDLAGGVGQRAGGQREVLAVGGDSPISVVIRPSVLSRSPAR